HGAGGRSGVGPRPGGLGLIASAVLQHVPCSVAIVPRQRVSGVRTSGERSEGPSVRRLLTLPKPAARAKPGRGGSAPARPRGPVVEHG
ncbi:hypothetical protein AB0J52_40985, partial [Spirillospora sp. NPDC049652]